MRRFLPLLILMVVLGCAVSAQAASPALVNGIKERYKTLESFSADFAQRLTHKESGSTETRRGTLRFKKPLLIRWETTSPSPETLVVTDKEIWDYLPDEEVAYRYSPDLVQDSRSIIQVLTGQAALDRDFDITEEGTENGLRKLHLYPKEPSAQMVEAFLWVDSSHLILRADIIDFYGNHNDVTFSAFKSNAGMPAGTFRFTPPDGVDVEDRLKNGQPERGLFN